MATVTDLGERIKKKFPGVYDTIDSAELGRKIQKKYPDAYQQFTEPKGSGPPSGGYYTKLNALEDRIVTDREPGEGELTRRQAVDEMMLEFGDKKARSTIRNAVYANYPDEFTQGQIDRGEREYIQTEEQSEQGRLDAEELANLSVSDLTQQQPSATPYLLPALGQTVAGAPKAIFNAVTENTRALGHGLSKLYGEGIAFAADPNVRQQAIQGDVTENDTKLTQMYREMQPGPQKDKLGLWIKNNIVNRQGINFEDILPEQGTSSVRNIVGQTIGTAAELAPMTKAGQLVHGTARGTVNLTGKQLSQQGAAQGGVYGTGYGFGGGLQEGKSVGDSMKQGLTSGLIGTAAGTVLAPVIGKLTQSIMRSASIRKASSGMGRAAKEAGDAYNTPSSVRDGIKTVVDTENMVQSGYAADPALAAEAPKFNVVEAARNISTKLEAFKTGLGKQFLNLVNYTDDTMDDVAGKAYGLLPDEKAGAVASKGATSAGKTAAKVTAVATKADDVAPAVSQKTDEVVSSNIINDGGTTTQQQNDKIDDLISAVTQDKKVKERGFITTIKEDPNTPQAVKDIVGGTYVPTDKAQTSKAARQFIEQNAAAAEQFALNPRNAVDVEIGNQLISHYFVRGNYTKIKQIGEAMAQSGTELGQAIQAFANYDPTTPSGAIRRVQTMLNRHNRTAKTAINLTDDKIAEIYDATAIIQTLKPGKDRTIASAKLMELMDELIPSSITDKALTVWKAGLLTSLRTHERNILGNTMMGISETAKDVPASFFDKLLGLKTGQRSMSFTMRGTFSGTKKGWKQAIDQIRYGFDPNNDISKFDIVKTNWGKSPVGKAMKLYTEIVFRGLGAEDKIFYQAAYRRSLFDQAGAVAANKGDDGTLAFVKNLVNNPTEEMMQLASTDASYATFRDATIIQNGISKAKNAVRSSDGLKALSEIAMPFTGVPTSILGKTIDYSPIGLAKGIARAGKVLTKNVPALQRQASQELGRGVIGTGIFALGAYLTQQGLMTGQPKNAEERDLMESQQIPWNSIWDPIGKRWRSINSIGPQTLVLLSGSKAQESLVENFAPGKFGGDIGKDFMNQSFLAGIQGPLEAINDPERFGPRYLSGQLSSIVPNILKDAAKSMTPEQKQINSVSDAFKASIPGLRSQLLPKRDVLGNIIQNQNTGGSAFLDLFNSKQSHTNPVLQEFSRINEVGYEVTPSDLEKTQTLSFGDSKGTTVKMSPAGLDALNAASVGDLNRRLEELIGSDEYLAKNDYDKKLAIDKAVREIRAEARKDFDIFYGATLDQYATQSGDPEDKDGDALPQDIFSVVKRYGDGFMTDPENALKALFTNEHLRKVAGNAVIVERKDWLDLLDKGDKNTMVDHIIPLAMGGDNSAENLRIITNEEHGVKSSFETPLWQAVRNGTISKELAQKTLLEWIARRGEQGVPVPTR